MKYQHMHGVGRTGVGDWFLLRLTILLHQITCVMRVQNCMWQSMWMQVDRTRFFSIVQPVPWWELYQFGDILAWARICLNHVKWYIKYLILHKFGKMTNILGFKDNNFHSIGLLNLKNIGADINITFLLHLVLEISLLLQKSCCCGHLGGHLEFWSLHKWDSRGLLICYLWVYYGLILKKLTCYEFCSPPTLMLSDYMFPSS